MNPFSQVQRVRPSYQPLLTALRVSTGRAGILKGDSND